MTDPAQVPPLTQEQVRQLLSECVTVVKPGEVLAVRVPDTWTPRQIGECQEAFEAMAEWRDLDIAILFMPGEEFAVAKKAKSAPGTVEINVTAPEGVDANALTAHLRGAAMNYRPRSA